MNIIMETCTERPCATDGCQGIAHTMYYGHGVGSPYCRTCIDKIWAMSYPEPAAPTDTDYNEGYVFTGYKPCSLEGQELVDDLFNRTDDTALTDAEVNQITQERLGHWPSFEAQSWACKVVHAVRATLASRDAPTDNAALVEALLADHRTACDLIGVDPETTSTPSKKAAVTLASRDAAPPPTNSTALVDYVTSFEVLTGPENDPISCGLLSRDDPWQSKPLYEAVVKLRWSGEVPPVIAALANSKPEKS